MTESDLYHFDELLERAVARCVGPNATGVFLSGGLDSVSVAAAAVNYAEAHGLPQPHALSLSFPDPECDEASIQRGVASQLGVSQTLLKFEDAVGPAGLIRCASELSAQLDSPLQNPWWPAYQALAREGKRNDCRIILTGGGGDEWLTTNPNHMADLLSHGDFVGAYHLGRSIHHSYRLPLMRSLRYLMWTAGVRPLLRSRLRKIAPSATEKIGVWRNRSTVPAWIAPDQELRRSVRVRREQMLIASLQRVPPTGRYAYYSDDTISTSLTSSLVSMEHEEDYLVGRRLGLRICRPYWDEDLVDFLRKVPPRLLLSGGRDKGIVRRFVSSRFSGLGFARQQKVSAQRYFYGLLDAEFREVWRGLGGAQRLSELELVDSKRVESAVSESLRDNEIRSKHRAWEILILEAWLRGQTT